MSFFTLIIISISLSMDAFALSISNVVNFKDFSLKYLLIQSFLFGLFQFLMAFIGYILGYNLKIYIEKFGYWIAFIILFLIGINMIKENNYFNKNYNIINIDFKILLLQSIAISIDSLAIGVGLSTLNINIVYSCITIGLITLLISLLGSILGKVIFKYLGKKSGVFGGIVLILISFKILISNII